MDFSNIADLLLSIGVVMLFVFLWGKIKTKMAYMYFASPKSSKLQRKIPTPTWGNLASGG